jgi:hypothetical protein
MFKKCRTYSKLWRSAEENNAYIKEEFDVTNDLSVKIDHDG